MFRRGLRASPEARVGLGITFVLGVMIAAGKVAIPIVLQRIIDDGIEVQAGGGIDVDLPKVLTMSSIAALVVVVSGVLALIAERRLVRSTEAALYGLRTRAFAHVHDLSLADHVDNSDGVFVARVTSDVQALARFCQWGLVAWTVGPTVIIAVFIAMAVYSWQLALLVFIAFLPSIPMFLALQRRQLSAHDQLRTAITGLMVEANEVISGAATVRAYDIGERAEAKVTDAANRRYRMGLRRNRYMAMAFSVGDFFGALALAAAFAAGVWQREAWGLSSGTLIAVLFLVTLLNEPIGEIGESTDQTQEAIAGWRKILELMDMPIDVVEPVPGSPIPAGAVGVSARNIGFSYRDGPAVLRDVSVEIPAGSNVAVVGETGSGKTTFAKLLCRLADPQDGVIELSGVALDQISHDARLAAVRMVPQDGFLFEMTLRENIRLGRAGATDDEIDQAVDDLGLRPWLDDLTDGLDTAIGARGAGLSVGERQLVALIRVALADPGLLVLDEATSSVDPETDQALTETIARLSAGRTVVSVAHRLATAEAADLVIVFDAGRIVETGHHDELVAAGGIYAGLHAAWIGNTRS